MNNLSIKIKQIDPLELKNFEIQDVSKEDSSGRRFILKSTKSSTKKLKLKSIYKKLEKLSKLKNQNPEDKLAKLNALKNFIKVIRDADHLAEAALNERHTYYKIVTWFLRIFSFGSHTKNLDHFDKSIQKKINKTNAEILEIQALTQAVRDGNVNYIKHLISKGMNFDVQDKDGETPLHLAANRPESEILNLIISSGSNINMTNSRGEIALFSSTKENLKILLESNIQAGLPSQKNLTFLQRAFEHNQLDIADLFIEIMGVNYQDNNQYSPLMDAIVFDKIDFALKLIEKNADVNLTDKNKNTALLIALGKNLTDLARIIIDKGVNLNHQNSFGETALMAAISRKEISIVNLLISKGANINLKTNEGICPLIYAVSENNFDIVKVLIDQGAELDLEYVEATALIFSIFMGSANIAKILIEKGSNLNFQMEVGTPFVLAKFMEKKEIVEMLASSLKNQELIAQKEMLNIKVLGHTINASGTIKIKTKESPQIYSASLESSAGSYFWKNIIKTSRLFSQKYPELMSALEFLRFNNLIKINLEEINNGIILDTGFKDHDVKVLIVGPFLFLINRGAASDKSVEVFQYDPMKLNQEILDKIKNQRYRNEDSYKKFFSTELPETLGFQPKGNFELEVEDFCSKFLPMQTAENCAWASSEGGMFVFFLMNQLQSFPSQIDPSQKKEILNKFYSWLSFTQTYNLERYLGTDVLRANPNKANRWKEARKAIDINYSLLFFSIKTIKANALKTNDPNKALDILKDVLAEALVTIKGDPQSVITANEIINNIEKMNSFNFQSKFAF